MTNETKPRDWVLNIRDGIINQSMGIIEYKGHPPKPSEIVHVIELWAYAEACKERDEAIAQAEIWEARNKDYELRLAVLKGMLDEMSREELQLCQFELK